MLVGHDLGSPVAAYCALARPDVFPSVVLMSAPFPVRRASVQHRGKRGIVGFNRTLKIKVSAAALAALDSRPREYYLQYLSTREANYDMWHPPQGLHAFLRAFFYVKSADWPGNKPHPLKARTAIEFAQMPTYYVMDLGKTMPPDRRSIPTFRSRGPGQQMAHRAGTWSVRGGVWPHWVSRRPAGLSRLFPILI